MSADRIPCKKCGAQILPATATANMGLCGTCKRKADDAKDHAEKLRKRKEEAAKPIVYDIDAILASDDFMTALDGALPEPDYPQHSKLTSIERHLQSLAEFARRCGGGFGTLVDNQYFDLLSSAHKAAKELGPSLLLDGLTELESLLRRYGFPRWISRRYDFHGSISRSDRDALDQEIRQLDSKFFTYETASIWSTPDFRKGTYDYAAKHADALRKRRP